MPRNLPKKIHVLKDNIHVEGKPVFAVIAFEGTTYGFSVEIPGPSKMVYLPKEEWRDCACGPRVWLETESEVTVDGKVIP